MPNFIVGARLHDYGKGTPDELFGKVSADGFAAVQLAYKKCVPSVKSYADVTDALVAETVAAEKAHHIQVAVLGTYVELAINDESRLCNVADFKSQLAVCKALGAGCIGTETTAMSKQPAGTTRAQAQELLCRSLAEILPAAEALGVGVPTLRDIAKELSKPGRDPRDELPAPILRTDVLDIKDLKPGMVLTGTVRNVIDFGVFVDIGVHQDGLVHISQVSNKFIKHPSEVVSVGDVVKVVVLEVDEKKKRISLSIKQAK